MKIGRHLRNQSATTLGLCLCLAAMPAYAQSEGAGAPEESAEGGLSDIVVTAQRKSESSQRAAVAIDVMSGDQIAQAGITSPNALDDLAPALDVTNVGGANTTFFVRGVGNFSTNAYTDPATAFNYDGVYIGRPASTAGLFYDLERIEVLKGPQGTLYGRNATAGAINVIPARPKPGETSGSFAASYGNYNALSAQAAINLPMGENGAIRVAGTISDRDGFLSDGTSDENVYALRVQMLAELTDNLTVRVQADYAHQGGRAQGAYYAVTTGTFNAATQSYSFNPTGFPSSQGVLDPISQAFRQTRFSGQARRNLTPLDPNSFLRDNFFGFNAEITYDSPIGTFTLLPAYRNAKLVDQHSSAGFTPFTQEKFEQTSVEARLGGGSGMFEYIAGLYFYDENVNGNYTFAQTVQSSYQDFETTTRSYAAFARLTAKLTDRFRVTGGIRYTDDNKTMDGAADTILQICPGPSTVTCPNAPLIPITDRPDQLPFAVPARGGAPLPVLVNGVATGAITVRSPAVVVAASSTNRLTFRAAVEYDIADRSLLYMSFENGYRSGGFSLANGRTTFEPEYINAYTIGSKNRFFDNRLQLNIEAFYWKYRNQQIAHFGLDGNGNNAFFTENVGRSTIKGIEVDTEIAVSDNTRLRGTVQYLEATFDDFRYNIPLNASPVVGCAFAPNPTDARFTTINCSGKPAYQSPKWVIQLGGEQTIPLGDHKLVLAVDTQYKTTRYVAFEYLPSQLAPAFWQTNASITFAQADNRWSVSAFVRNLENYRDVTSGTLFGPGNYVALRPGAPRTYGVRVAAKF
jgi:iron complex outermembrane recepter protein